VTTAAALLLVGTAVVFHPAHYPYARPENMDLAVPAVKQARHCGTISVTGVRTRRNPIMSTLAALGRMPLNTFSPFQFGAWRRSGAVLRVKPAHHARLVKNPPWAEKSGASWVKVQTTVGQLWLTQACVQKGGLLEGAQAVPVTFTAAG
jgi:hypothetical protein